MAGIIDGLTVVRDDDIGRPHAPAIRRREAIHAVHERAPQIANAELRRQLGRERIDIHSPEPPAQHLAVLDQLVDDAPGQVARDRKSDPLVAASTLAVWTLADYSRVDADQLAARVDEPAARISRIDRRIGLNEIFVLRKTDVGAAHGADDALRD